ncbi:MAG: hypothetical protein KDB22_03850 [Planctomycetales bacterium]|nr:hypothetical protein [Planctomycetales bacterium]
MLQIPFPAFLCSSADTMDFDTIVIVVACIAAIAIIPGFRFFQRALFFASGISKIVVVMLGLILTAALSVGFFYLPFFLSQDKEVTQDKIFSDFSMFSLFPLGVIALVGYVADHMANKDTSIRPLVAAAALVALAIVPTLYYFYSEQMHQQLNIVITKP